MNRANYKIIEERILSKEEALKGMNFEQALTRSVSIKSSLAKLLKFGALVIAVGTVSIILLYKKGSSEKQVDLPKEKVQALVKEKEALDTSLHVVDQKINPAKKELRKDTVYQKEEEQKTPVSEDEYANANYVMPRSLSFKIRANTDAETAFTIKDSIYGPGNVSTDRGEFCEYKDPNNEIAVEKHSAWFRFTIQKDTLLTFHIVPTLKTDDYDFALFKCNDYNCLRDLKLGKLKPVRSCFGWNTTSNSNTGLSNKRIDTTFQKTNYLRELQGKTYVPALRVKAGETYYLMINSSLHIKQDPEGFMIYFYNYLPKGRANTYSEK